MDKMKDGYTLPGGWFGHFALVIGVDTGPVAKACGRMSG